MKHQIVILFIILVTLGMVIFAPNIFDTATNSTPNELSNTSEQPSAPPEPVFAEGIPVVQLNDVVANPLDAAAISETMTLIEEPPLVISVGSSKTYTVAITEQSTQEVEEEQSSGLWDRFWGGIFGSDDAPDSDNITSTHSEHSSGAEIDQDRSLTTSADFMDFQRAALSSTVTSTSTATTTATHTDIDRWYVNAAVFQVSERAEQMMDELFSIGFKPRIEESEFDDIIYYKLTIGPYQSEAHARAAVRRLRNYTSYEGSIFLQ